MTNATEALLPPLSAHLEVAHAVPAGVALGLALADLPLELVVEAVAYQHLGHARGVLE